MSRRFITLSMATLLGLLTASLFVHAWQGEHGSLNVKSLSLLFISGFILGALSGATLCEGVNPNSKLSKIITESLGISILVVRVVTLIVWLSLAGLFVHLWDAEKGRFVLRDSSSVIDILSRGQECIGSGLLAQSQVKASKIYNRSVLIGSIEQVDKQSFSLYLDATQKTLLLELIDNNPDYLGLGSQLEQIGWIACRR